MEPDATCWHEAGHALMAHLVGAHVRLVTLESDLDDHEGLAEIVWNNGFSDLERSRRSAMIAIAGPLAELAFRGDADLDDPDVLASWQNDWNELEECLMPLAPDPRRRELLRHQLSLTVREMLAEPSNHERLARVADMLAAHGTLDHTLFGDAVR